MLETIKNNAQKTGAVCSMVCMFVALCWPYLPAFVSWLVFGLAVTLGSIAGWFVFTSKSKAEQQSTAITLIFLIALLLLGYYLFFFGKP